MRRIILAMVALTLALTGLAVAPVQAQDFFGDGWQAQYYDNPNLTGAPVLTNSIARLQLTFGESSPGTGVPADNFSAVFTTNETFQSETEYEFVAIVDDGVRVTVGGQTIIDQFNSGAGTYTGRLRTVGTQSIRVEYREGSGSASIEFFWRVATQSAREIPPGAITATVINASALVVRDGPSLGSTRIGTIRRGELFEVVGRDANARWFLLNLGDRQGWAWGFYLFVDGNEFNPPVVGQFALTEGLPDVPLTVQATSGIRLRSQPNVQSAQIGRITWGASLPVIGRSERGSWYQVVWKGTTGWVFAPNTRAINGNVNDVPFVPGSGAQVQIGAAANPPYDISVPGSSNIAVSTPTPAGPTPIPVEPTLDFTS